MKSTDKSILSQTYIHYNTNSNAAKDIQNSGIKMQQQATLVNNNSSILNSPNLSQAQQKPPYSHNSLSRTNSNTGSYYQPINNPSSYTAPSTPQQQSSKFVNDIKEGTSFIQALHDLNNNHKVLKMRKQKCIISLVIS